MTEQEKVLLKQWLISEDFRLSQEKENALVALLAHPNRIRCKHAAEVLAVYEYFGEFARKLDALLHLFP